MQLLFLSRQRGLDHQARFDLGFDITGSCSTSSGSFTAAQIQGTHHADHERILR
jgi:hypothetical protein